MPDGWLDVWVRVRSLLRQAIARHKPEERDSAQQYFFIHIHKTAGTAFRYMLYEHFDQSEIFPNLSDIRRFGGRYPRYPELLETDPAIFSRIRLLTGHYPFVAKDILPQRPRCLVFLREPVSRAASNLFHLQTHEYSAGASMETVFQRATNAVFNVQTRFFTMPYHQQPLTRNDLEAAKRNLAQCDFVGLTEEFEDSVLLAERIFGWRLGKTLSLNVNQGRAGELEQMLIERLQDGNALDLEFYEYGKSLFRGLQRRYEMI